PRKAALHRCHALLLLIRIVPDGGANGCSGRQRPARIRGMHGRVSPRTTDADTLTYAPRRSIGNAQQRWGCLGNGAGSYDIPLAAGVETRRVKIDRLSTCGKYG